MYLIITKDIFRNDCITEENMNIDGILVFCCMQGRVQLCNLIYKSSTNSK